MKVKEITGKTNGDFTIVLESEHPAELALINLLDTCEAKCARQEASVHPGGSAVELVVSDPLLVITAQVKKNARGY
jgi:hypothetical protein